MSFRIKLIISLIVCCSIALGYFYEENNAIHVDEINVKVENLPKELKGFRIVQISDLHLPQSKGYVEKVIEKARDAKGDIILLTGDIVDSRSNVKDSGFEEFIKEICKVAPVYGVTGNHETRGQMRGEWKKVLTDNGGKFVEGRGEVFKKNGKSIFIMGMVENAEPTLSSFKGFKEHENMPRILLSHRPEIFKKYFTFDNGNGFDVVFSGHAHGGQFRIPFINRGLVAPNQGLFPKYVSGAYEFGNGNMVVSRGLGNSFLLPRFNNRVHMPVVILE